MILSSILKKNILTRLVNGVNIDSRLVQKGVTSQFIENAQTYHDRYYDNAAWTHLVAMAIAHANIDKSLPLNILDIGSGSGNTVFAATELLPNSTVYATDISHELLSILVGIKDHLTHLHGRIEAFCFDLHKDFFADNTFDLVIGGAILHHMLDPGAVLKNVGRWLRPGGKVLLMEPLEAGAHMMNAVYLTLLAELEAEPNVDPRLISFFKAMSFDYEARYGASRIKPWTHELDDKWLFSQSYLHNVGDKSGLVLDNVVPIVPDTQNAFSNWVRYTLKQAGLEEVVLPKIGYELLEQFDRGVSKDLKEKLSLEGVIIFSKP